MADLIDLDDLSPQQGLIKRPGDFTRDSRKTPHVSDPDGAVVKSGPRKGEIRWARYGRPSSLGKDIENSFGLQRWRERQIIYGLGQAPPLEVGSDPEDPGINLQLRILDLHGTPFDDVKDELDDLVVLCKKFAKSNLAAEQGTHTHEVTELEDSENDERDPVALMEHGQIFDLPLEAQRAMLEAWREGVQAYGLVMLEVERKVVHDEWRQAGTLDRLALLTQDITFDNGVVLPAGAVLLLDVKTGKLTLTAGGLVQYWHSYAVQCAVYAASVPYDVDTDTRGEWEHEIDQRWAIIAHLPVQEALAGKATLRLVLCDIAAGREAIETIVTPMKEWNARHDLFHFTAAHEPKIEIAVEGPVHISDCVTETLYRMWLTGRLAQIGAHAGAKAHMVTLWPEGVPGLKSDHVHTQAELEAIEAVVVRVEAMHQLPFAPDPRPAPEMPMPVQAERWVAPDEGDILGMEHEDVVGLRQRVERLDPAEKSIAEQWMKEAVDAHRGFSIRQLPSRRRWLIYRLVLDLATTFEGDVDIARATLAIVLPEAEQLGVTLGCAFGSLTIDEARRLLDLLPVLAKEHALIFDGDIPRWSAVSAA